MISIAFVFQFLSVIFEKLIRIFEITMKKTLNFVNIKDKLLISLKRKKL